MALGTAEDLNQAILALPTTILAPAGVAAFAAEVGSFMDNVQAGSTGSAGILTFNQPLFIVGLLALATSPVADDSWITPFAAAWAAAVSASVIAPGTVTDPAWTASTVDVNTLPIGASTITTIADAKSELETKLADVAGDATAALPLATAIRDATLKFEFNCIGLALPAVPVPLPFSAE